MKSLPGGGQSESSGISRRQPAKHSLPWPQSLGRCCTSPPAPTERPLTPLLGRLKLREQIRQHRPASVSCLVATPKRYRPVPARRESIPPGFDLKSAFWIGPPTRCGMHLPNPARSHCGVSCTSCLSNRRDFLPPFRRGGWAGRLIEFFKRTHPQPQGRPGELTISTKLTRMTAKSLIRSAKP